MMNPPPPHSTPEESDSARQILALRASLRAAIMATIQPHTRTRIPETLDVLGLPAAPDDPELSKTKYIDARLGIVPSHDVVRLAGEFLNRHAGGMAAAQRFALEEELWSLAPAIHIPKRVRYELARALEGQSLFLRPQPFLDLITRLWDREDFGFGPGESALIREVKRHVVNNPEDWPTDHFFEQLGLFEASDARVARFIEGLASCDLRPDESSQREYARAVNEVLMPCGLELRETGGDGGFPTFRLTAAGGVRGRAKNLIFASETKPDLRFRDAVNNDIEILSAANEVLVYDRPIPPHGLRWRDLQAWWAEEHHVSETDAKGQLYRRLLHALPKNSPPQTLFFKTFFERFATRIPDLPALLPEVWLHWDPVAARDRGPDALARFRMDFLMLFSDAIRVVIEVDGKHHYADETGRPDTARYAAMVAADRDLRFAGYDVYRFGAAELNEARGPKVVGEFFDQLFRRYPVQS